MKALVVHESMFGNTEAVAAMVATGLEQEGFEVTSQDVTEAEGPHELEVDLLVVGGPTHAFSMTRESTRADAVRQGAPAERAAMGLREWLAIPPRGTETKPEHTRLAAAFDTRARKVRYLPKTAGTRSGHVLEHLGFTLVAKPMGFLVDDVSGPLVEGETERARAWGRQLAQECRQRLSTRR